MNKWRKNNLSTCGSEEKWGYKEQSLETGSVLKSFVSYPCIRLVFDVLSPSPILNSLCSFQQKKKKATTLHLKKRLLFYFSDTCNQSKLFMVAQTLKHEQIWGLFPSLLLLWTKKRKRGQEKATSLMAHYVLWQTKTSSVPSWICFCFMWATPVPTCLRRGRWRAFLNMSLDSP